MKGEGQDFLEGSGVEGEVEGVVFLVIRGVEGGVDGTVFMITMDDGIRGGVEEGRNQEEGVQCADMF